MRIPSLPMMTMTRGETKAPDDGGGKNHGDRENERECESRMPAIASDGTCERNPDEGAPVNHQEERDEPIVNRPQGDTRRALSRPNAERSEQLLTIVAVGIEAEMKRLAVREVENDVAIRAGLQALANALWRKVEIQGRNAEIPVFNQAPWNCPRFARRRGPRRRGSHRISKETARPGSRPARRTPPP